MTRALYHARELAMTRMEEEADALGADGIVGVRLTVKLGVEPAEVGVGPVPRVAGLGARASGSRGRRRALGAGVAVRGPGRGADVDALLLADGLAAGAAWRRGCARARWPASAFGQNAAEFLAIGCAVRHREGEQLPEQARQAVPVRPERAGLLAAHPHRVPAGGLRDGQLRLLRAPGAAAGAGRAELRARLRTPTRSTTRASWRPSGCRTRPRRWTRRASSASPSPSASTRGASRRGTPATAALQSGEVIELFVIGTAVVPTPGGRAGSAPGRCSCCSANDARGGPGGRTNERTSRSAPALSELSVTEFLTLVARRVLPARPGRRLVHLRGGQPVRLAGRRRRRSPR